MSLDHGLADDSDHRAFRHIEALAESGITAKCSASPPLYCDEDPITRARLAVFLATEARLVFPSLNPSRARRR